MDWIRKHHHVIHSPIARDSLLVPDPDNKGKLIRKSRLLLQCSVRRELYSDLYKPDIGLGDDVRDKDGKPLISDTMMRALLLPELRTITGRYKQMCCCEVCV